MADVMLDPKKMTLRKKMLGVRIRHARNRVGLSLQAVGEALGTSSNLVADIEFGRRDASLPQLEVMSVLFNVPVFYFWSDDAIEEGNGNFPTLEAMTLRQRIIGVLLRQARMKAGRSREDLARVLDIPTSQVSSYEEGASEIPLLELELLAQYLNVPLNYFLDEGISPNKSGGQTATLDEIAQFSQLPPEVRRFLLNPANLLYVNIAMRLSGLSAETLRNLAEGLLEVTY